MDEHYCQSCGFFMQSYFDAASEDPVLGLVSLLISPVSANTQHHYGILSCKNVENNENGNDGRQVSI